MNLRYCLSDGSGIFFFCTRVRIFLYLFVILAVFYLCIKFVRCLVDSEISRDVYKLIRTPRIIKKNKNDDEHQIKMHMILDKIIAKISNDMIFIN